MRSNCRTNILSQFSKIKQLPQNCQSKECILVLDNKTSKLISFIISLQHIFQFGFKDLARADKKKKAQPNAAAIYFIGADSLHYVYQDFEDKPIYFSINILLCDEISDKIMKEISKKQTIIERLASFGQLHLPCSYVSQNCAKMHINEIKKQKSLTLLSHMVNKMQIKQIILYTKIILNSLITNIGNISSITLYYYDSPLNRKIVQTLKEMFLIYQQENKQSKEENNAIILLGQREMDILSPLVTNFYYYPLLFDILKAEHDEQNGKLIIKEEQGEISLGMEDKIFQKYKNMHVYKAFQNINNDLQNFKQTSKTAKFQKGDQQNVKDVLKQLPEYNQTINNYKYNLQIMDKIGNMKSKYKLDEICELQHTIVTGYNAKMQTEKDKKLLSRGLQFVEKTQDSFQKTKILLSMIFCLEMKNSEREDLIKRLSKVQGYSQIAMNIPKLISKTTTKYKLMKYQNKKDYILDRHQPIICYALEEILKGSTPEKFKRVQIGQKLSPSKTKKRRSENSVNVVMSGGIGINELSGLQKIGRRQKYQVQVICDGVMNGREYLRQLAMI